MSTPTRPYPFRKWTSEQMLAEGRRIASRTLLYGCVSINRSLTRIRKQQYLPLLDSEAHATILSGTFKIVLKQSYLLSSKQNAECIYKFPLYDGVSVVGFKCNIGTNPALYAVVKEKTKVEAISNAAAAEGDSAGLLAQALEDSYVFTTRIGNIQSGEKVFIEITYIGELKLNHSAKSILFTVPTVIAPQYASTESIKPRIPVLDHHPKDRIRITVDICVPAGTCIKGIELPSHPIVTLIGTISTAADAAPVTNKASVTLSLGAIILEKDFILNIHTKDPGIPTAVLETHSTILNHRVLMITLAASKFSFLSSFQSEIVLVVDRSASMRHDIPILASAFKVFLKSMPTSVRFNICSFGTKQAFLWPQSKGYTNSTLQEATEHLSTFDADYGGTEIFEVVRTTIERRLKDLPLNIILFTDAHITDQGSPLGYINEQVEKERNTRDEASLLTSVNELIEKSTQGGVRIFSIGIGNKGSRTLIEGLASVGKGLSLVVQNGERLEKGGARILRAALSPQYGDSLLEVKYGQDHNDFEWADRVIDTIDKPSILENEELTTSLSDPSDDLKDLKLPENHHFPHIIQAPYRIPSVFTATKQTIYLLIGPNNIQRNPTSVVLRSPFPHSPPALEIPIGVLTEPGTTIHQLAARKAAQDLEESQGWVFEDVEKTATVQKLAEREAVRLGETFQVLNKWCSFVAVSTKDGKELFIQNAILQEDVTTNSPYRSPALPPKPPKPALTTGDQSEETRAGPPYFGYRNFQRYMNDRDAPQIVAKVITYPQPSRRAISRTLQARSVAKDVKAESDTNAFTTTTTSVPPISPLNPNLTKVLALIDLQHFNGLWNTDSENRLLDILGFEIPRPPPVSVSDEAWVTMLVARFLEDVIPEEEDVWGLVVEKAREFVRECLENGGDLQLLEEMAGLAVRGSVTP
jgi:hypothetical protein